MEDLILNGQAHGTVAQRLLDNNFNPGALRPYLGDDGRRVFITTNRNGKMVPAQVVGNTAATLRKDEWIQLDEAVVMAAKSRLQIVGDLRSRGLVYTIPNGMGKTVLETQTETDIEDAEIHMDPAVPTEQDRPHYDITALPLPVVHKDFSFSAREIATARNSGSPLDTTMAALAGRKVAEQIEKLTLGVASSYKYGGGFVYGLVNFPSAITTVDITAPTDTGWTGQTIVEEVLEMRQAAYDAYHWGPYVLYNSPAWDRFLDEDYSAAKGDNTVRQRLEQIRGIEAVRTADYLGSGYKMVLVQQTTDVIRMVMGMDITTVQWETMGGLKVHFKVMAIMVPQLRADSNGNTGLVYATTA